MKTSRVIGYGLWRPVKIWKAPLVLFLSMIVALIALTGCSSASRSNSGKNGLDEILEDASYSTIAPGEFVMGSPKLRGKVFRSANSRGASGLDENEHPQRCVFINKGFDLGKWEVTQEQWHAVMNSNPSSFKGPQLPVINVSWNDAQEFLSRMQSFDPAHNYRLPTEAEWEYACRAGVESEFSSEALSSQGEEAKDGKPRAPEESEMILKTIGWFNSNAFNHPHLVGQLNPNAWGLFDMHGNVREWCQDWYDPNYYKSDLVDDPQGPQTGAMKVNRGGSWQSPADMCRSAARAYDLPTERSNLIGFRIVRTKK